MHLIPMIVVTMILGAPDQFRFDPRLPRTDPATWEDAGWLGFQWGMGPGDVLAIVRNPASDTYSEAPPTRFTSTVQDHHESLLFVRSNLKIAGEQMAVSFSFFRGRLYEVAAVGAFVFYGLEPGAPVSLIQSEEDMERRGRPWREKVIRLLSEKYGQPRLTVPRQEWVRQSITIEIMSPAHLRYMDSKVAPIAKQTRDDAWRRKEREDGESDKNRL